MMSDVIHQNTYNSSINYFTSTLEMQVKYAVMLEYVKGRGTVRLYLDNYGLKLKGQMAIGQLAGNTKNLFSNRNIYGAVKSNSVSVSGLIALIEEGAYLTALWGVYSTSEPGKFNNGVTSFGTTVKEQTDRWGKVVRGVELDSGSGYIQDVGNRFGLSGEIRWTTTWSYKWGLNYSASTI